MPWIVGMVLLLAAGLNAPSTAHAANRCIHLGWSPAGARGIVALRPGTEVRATCPPATSSEPLTRVTVLGPGWHVDAFLIGIVVSLVATDTPQDVLFWGAITGVALRRAV